MGIIYARINDDELEKSLKKGTGPFDGKGKRGIPRNVYIVVRSIFDKRSRTDLEFYEKLEKLAEERQMKVADYV